jgi:transposase
MVRDPETRKYRRTRLFVMTLGCSRKSVRLLAFRSSARIWAELHERAFRRFGGATRIVILDNLREGVLVPDVYDPTLNPLYRDVLAHYGAVAMPCRIQDPDRNTTAMCSSAVHEVGEPNWTCRNNKTLSCSASGAELLTPTSVRASVMLSCNA